jgi:hypothetical protein
MVSMFSRELLKMSTSPVLTMLLREAFSALPHYFMVGWDSGLSGIDEAAAADYVLFF